MCLPRYFRCWTQGKPDKLIYLRKAAMWYLTEVCSPLENLIEAPFHPEERNKVLPPGEIFKFTDALVKKTSDVQEQWAELGSKCCMRMPDAP